MRGSIHPISLLTTCFVALLACACGNGASSTVSAPEATGQVPAISAPAGLLRTASQNPSASLDGCDYSADLPNNLVEVEETSLRFSPDYPNDDPGAGLAYAIFELSLYSEDFTGLLTTFWSESADAGDLYIGIANFDRNGWDWYPVADYTEEGVARIEFDITGCYREIEPGLWRVMAVPLLLGSDAWLLDEVRLGDYLMIDSIYPRWGMTGETCRPVAYFEGIGPYEYAWDFGGGATPNTSTEASPELIAGELGTYDATVTITSDHGSDTMDFDFVVYGESVEWSRSWYGFTRKSPWTNILGSEVVVDVAGDIYQIGKQDMAGTYRNVYWIVKYNSSGMELWNRFWVPGLTSYLSDAVIDADGNLNVLIMKKPIEDDMLNYVVLIQFSPEGDILHQKKLSLPEDDLSACRLRPLDSGGVYLGLSATGADHEIVVRLDANWNVIWGKTYQTERLSTVANSLRDFAIDDSDNIYLTGSTYPGGDPLEFPSLFHVVKIDQDGTLLWEKAWGNGYHSLLFELEIGPDANLYGFGTIQQYVDSVQDLFYTRLTPDGELLSIQVYDQLDWDYAGEYEFLNGVPWLVYTSNDKSSTDYHNAVTRLDLDGNIQEPLCWTGDSKFRLFDLVAWDDTSIVVSGYCLGAGGTWGTGTAPSVDDGSFTEEAISGTISDFTIEVSEIEFPMGTSTNIDMTTSEYIYSMALNRHSVEE